MHAKVHIITIIHHNLLAFNNSWEDTIRHIIDFNNEKLIRDGKVEIQEGNVKNLPFEEDTFDIVTAFETVYFWSDIEKCFGEVKRVLKPGGIFLIGMESNGSDNFIMKFWKHFIDMELYTDEEITSFLQNNNFSEITAYIRDGRKKH